MFPVVLRGMHVDGWLGGAAQNLLAQLLRGDKERPQRTCDRPSVPAYQDTMLDPHRKSSALLTAPECTQSTSR